LGATEQALLTDPQTSGGLLVACDPASCDEVMEIFRSEGFGHAAVVGEMVAGPPQVAVN
jgi:selenide,water dikinase